MKIKYVFCNEEVEIEVSEEWGAIILDMDREERNNNQAETRRHCSLECFNLDTEFPASEDPERDVLTGIENEQLLKSMEHLSLRQKHLIEQYFFNEKSISAIAKEEGRDWKSVREALDRAVKKLRFYLQ